MFYLFIQTGTIIPSFIREQMLGMYWTSALNKAMRYLVFMAKMLLDLIQSGHEIVPNQAL